MSLQGLDALLQSTAGSFTSASGAQQAQNGSQTALESLLSSQSGLQTSAQSLFQPISRAHSATSTQFSLSQYSSVDERLDGVSTATSRPEAQLKSAASLPLSQANRTTEMLGSSQFSSTDSTSLSAAAPYFPFSAAANGQTVSSPVQLANRPRSASTG